MAQFSHRVVTLASLSCMLLGFPKGLLAQPTLPDSSAFTLLSAEIFDRNNNVTFPSAGTFGFASLWFDTPAMPAGSGDFSMTGTVVGGLDPSVANTVTESVLSDPRFQSGQSSTSFSYNFSVIGPSTVPVAVEISGKLSDSWTSNVPSGGLFDSAQLGIYDQDNKQVKGWTIADPGDASGGETLNVNETMLLSTNTLYTVLLGTDAGIQLSNAGVPISNGTYTTSVSIDPMLTIDPSFQLPGYSLDLSADLEPTPVPDLGYTAAMLMASLALTVALQGRRMATVSIR
jgi:hypothetical protein